MKTQLNNRRESPIKYRVTHFAGYKDYRTKCEKF